MTSEMNSFRETNPYFERISFAKLESIQSIPDLVDIQRRSYSWFLQSDSKREERKYQGLEQVFREIFPIYDSHEKNLTLEYSGYTIGGSKYSEYQCCDRDQTYSAPLKIKVRLINQKTGELREQDVYMGDIPLMTSRGTFILNGAERVIVNQIQRSPGVVFDHDEGKTDPSGKRLYSAKIIPYHGAWIEMEYEIGDVLSVRLDKKRKLPVTVFLRTIGFEKTSDILKLFYQPKVLKSGSIGEGKDHPWTKSVLIEDIIDSETGEIVVLAGAELNEDII